MSDSVNLEVLVAERARQPKDMDELTARLERLGIRVTGRGAATLSAEISPTALKQVFGIAVTTSTGFVSLESSNASLPIPSELSGDVDLVTLVPRHQRFTPD